MQRVVLLRHFSSIEAGVEEIVYTLIHLRIPGHGLVISVWIKLLETVTKCKYDIMEKHDLKICECYFKRKSIGCASFTAM